LKKVKNLVVVKMIVIVTMIANGQKKVAIVVSVKVVKTTP
jgi:hypothetical protein